MGLVPKAGGETRLIFHLSYDFVPSEHQKSINYHTPEDICKVRYNDLDAAVRNCMHIMQQTGTKVLFFGKTDCSHAFRIMPIKISHRKFLTMKARHPKTKKWWYFVDKCLPFGSSISCAQFQAFSDALKHVAEWSIQITLQMDIPPSLTNYLDDFLTIAVSEILCNQIMRQFLAVCEEIRCPISSEKTE